MRIAVISDTHLGCAFGTEKENDSFEQFEESLNKAISGKADLIILPGDIFDSRIPKQEVWAKALRLFQKPILADKNGTKLDSFIGKEKNLNPLTLNGIPVIAIHGTHERRGEHLVNPVELLEKAGYLIHLDKTGVVFEKNSEKTAVVGLSGIPEKDVKKTLEEWNPKPAENAFNIFVFHQSTKEEIYDRDDAFISVDELPKGFDLYIDGHIHWRKYIPEKKFLIAGSTVITQQKETEAQQGKGFFMIETSPLKVDFIKLESQRPFFFKKILLENADQLKVNETIEQFLKTIPLTDKKPLVKIKLTGSMEAGRRPNQIDLSNFKKKESMIISIDNEIESEDLKKIVNDLRSLHMKKKSVDEMGMDLVKSLLEKTNYSGLNIEEIIEPLADGNTDFVMRKVEERIQS